MVLAVFLGSNAPTPLYRQWQQQWGFGDTVLAVVYAAYMAGLVLALTLAGRIADRYGRRVVLLPGIALAAAAAVLFLVAQDAVTLIVARGLSGLAIGTVLTAGLAAVVDLAPPRRRGAASVLGAAASVLGAGLGPLVAGAVAAVIGAPVVPVFLVVLALVVVAAVVVLRLPAWKPDRVAGARVAAGAAGRLWRWPGVPRANRLDLAWGVAGFAPGICCTAFVLSLGPSVLAEGTGREEPLLAGVASCVMFFTAAALQFACVRVPRIGQVLLSCAAAVVCVAAFVLFALALPSPVLFVAAAVLAGAAQGLGQLAGITLIAERVPTERRAEANAALSIAGYLPAGALTLLAGVLADLLGLTGGVVGFALVIALAAVAGAAFVRGSAARSSDPDTALRPPAADLRHPDPTPKESP